MSRCRSIKLNELIDFGPHANRLFFIDLLFYLRETDYSTIYNHHNMSFDFTSDLINFQNSEVIFFNEDWFSFAYIYLTISLTSQRDFFVLSTDWCTQSVNYNWHITSQPSIARIRENQSTQKAATKTRPRSVHAKPIGGQNLADFRQVQIHQNRAFFFVRDS